MRHPDQLHTGTVPWPQIRLLVYSQDESFRFLVRQTFRKLAVREVLAATAPAEADKMMKPVPDIALVDVHGQPDAALAFLRALRDADSRMPVLLVARAAERGHLAPLLALGTAGVVPKPVSGHELVHRVGESALPPAPIAAEAEAPPAAAPARIRPGPGNYGDDSPPAAAIPGGGTYGDAAPPAPPPSQHPLETADAALPAALRPTRRQGAEAEQAEAERARWLAELAADGHHPRTGRDVAGLDVAAIVAAHVDWLTSQGTGGKRADCGKMDLAGVDLGGAVLANAGFRAADLSDARLAEARLDGADFRHAVLGAADLSAANLAVAQLRHCDLRLANLQGASLRGADLSGARLGGAKLAGADFKGAILVGCDLGGADLAQADGLAQAQVDKAACDPATRLPPGLIRPAANADQ